MLKRYIVICSVFLLFLMVGGCAHDSQMTQLKADYFTIGMLEESFEAQENLDTDMIQELTNAYNEIKYTDEVDEPVNDEQSIFITFIHNDQISGSVQVDNTGNFNLGDTEKTYVLAPDSNFYETALEVYSEVKKHYEPHAGQVER
ncbi:hypothetical protein [Sporosarcina cascadiensis]|uniref:hypothetical protein n=1 Tax=Sporosarcina cascadiensis TaxID=2660747 RepID=UPI00129B5B80|nr:hypothetical protein [Sporosarcina cascadiensis]